MEISDETLINHLRERYFSDKDTTRFDILDFVSAFGSPLLALMYAKLFWPDFVEIGDMIFLKSNLEVEENRRRVMAALEKKEDNSGIEKSFNLVEVPVGIFANKMMSDSSFEENHFLAERLAEMWKCRLSLLFPNRRFIVNVLEPEETGGAVGVEFYQKRD